MAESGLLMTSNVGPSQGITISGDTSWTVPWYVNAGPTLDQKAKHVLLALVKHVDRHGYVHLEETNDAIDDGDANTLTTHAIHEGEQFAVWVDRLYHELCVVRGHYP